MSKSFFRQFQNEDWIATLMGLLLVVTVIVLPGLIPVFPKELNTVEAWLSPVYVAFGYPCDQTHRIRVGFLFSGPRIADPQYRGIARVAFARSPQ